jgi:hypothetical protein
MNDDRYAQYGAVTGIVFVVLIVIGFLIVTPTPPDLNAASDEWPRYFSEEQGAIRAGLVLVTIGWFFFIWFLGTVASTLRIAAGTPRLPSIAFAGGILTAGSLFMAITALAVATLHPETRSPELTRTLNDFAVMAGVPAIEGAVAFFGAIALVIFRSPSALPIWLAWLSATAAAVQLLSFGIIFTDEGAFAGDGVLGLFIPLAVALVTVAALSALLTAWARDAARPGGIGITDRIRGGVTGAVTGAAAGVRGERPPTQRPPQ